MAPRPAWKIQENFPIPSDSQPLSHLPLQSSFVGFSFSFGRHNRMPLVVQTKKLLHHGSAVGFCGVFLLHLQTADTAVSSWVCLVSVLSLWRHHSKPVSVSPLSIEGLSPNMAMRTSTQEVDEIWLSLYNAWLNNIHGFWRLRRT